MTPPESSPPKVFISYSHDSPEHIDLVLELSNRFRDEGIDSFIDQYVNSPAEGWPKWMDSQIKEADFVLIICTPTYKKRVEGKEKPGVGLGVLWESELIYQHIYNAGTTNTKFIPILLEGNKVSDIPTLLQSATYYQPSGDEGYEELYRRLTNQPSVTKPQLGKLRRLAPHERKLDFITKIWNVRYERNPFFTGRDSTIENLHEALLKNSAGALTQVISGLGGIGKTQVAVEYCYRYKEDYKYVFWARADSTINLNSSFFEIAGILNLPQKNEKDTNEIVQAVKRWLEVNAGWLIVFDNAENPSLIKDYRPLNPKGHIILTSRAQVFQVLGILKPIDIGVMSEEEAKEFLFKRTNRENLDTTENVAAGNLARELGYLPLALEQAGAYLTEKQARFQDYLATYTKRRLELLSESGPVIGDYHESVATTWSINFTEVKNASLAAADVLYLSSFLSPDNIPLELFMKGSAQLGPQLSTILPRKSEDTLIVNSLLEPLTRYSLIHREIASHSYSIHRLVQEVIKHRMDKNTSWVWTERAINALNSSFPEVEFENWPLCERLLPHGKILAGLIEKNEYYSEDAGRLINQIGEYLIRRASYSETELLFKLALKIREKVLAPEHQDITRSINNLAVAYEDLGKYREAEPLFQQALANRERSLGPDHSETAMSLGNLANLYIEQGEYVKAEPLLKQALAINEKVCGTTHLNTAASLNNLGGLYYEQGKYVEATPLFERALAICEKLLSSEHPDLATSLSNLAESYSAQGEYAKSEHLFRRALAIRQKVLGLEHPDTATTLNNLGGVFRRQSENDMAEPLFLQALAIREKFLGPDHPDTASSLGVLAGLYLSRKENDKAEPLSLRSLAIREKILGPEHPDTAQSLRQLAGLYVQRKKYANAVPLFKRSLNILKRGLGSLHPEVANCMLEYANALRKMDHNHEAAKLESQAAKIERKLSKS